MTDLPQMLSNTPYIKPMMFKPYSSNAEERQGLLAA